MRKVGISRIFVLSALLLLTAGFLYMTETRLQQSSKEPLNTALSSLSGWQASPPISMGAMIEEALNLDDYLFRSYKRGNDTVSLYIGYYRSAAKIGAAHDPLVCFSGQGWRILERGKGRYQLPEPDKVPISYATMIAEQQNEKEYLVYWFQTNDLTASGTLEQKAQMLMQRLKRVPREENAFVRVSTSMNGDSPEAARKRIFEFINSFYPEFHRYVSR